MILKKWIRVLKDLKTGEYCALLCSLEQEAKKAPTGSLELVGFYEIEIPTCPKVYESAIDDFMKAKEIVMGKP